MKVWKACGVTVKSNNQQGIQNVVLAFLHVCYHEITIIIVDKTSESKTRKIHHIQYITAVVVHSPYPRDD